MKSTLTLIFAALLACVSAFAPASRPVLTPGRLIQGGRNLHTFVLSAEEKTSAGEDAPPKSAKNSDGTYYDDEVEPAPKAGISDSMKERLLREASTGLDAEQKQDNVLLYIIAGVAVLVLVGGQGILY